MAYYQINVTLDEALLATALFKQELLGYFPSLLFISFCSYRCRTSQESFSMHTMHVQGGNTAAFTVPAVVPYSGTLRIHAGASHVGAVYALMHRLAHIMASRPVHSDDLLAALMPRYVQYRYHHQSTHYNALFDDSFAQLSVATLKDFGLRLSASSPITTNVHLNAFGLWVLKALPPLSLTCGEANV